VRIYAIAIDLLDRLTVATRMEPTMKSADRLCVGYAPQPPHVPNDGATITILDGRGARLCRDCWRRWRSTDSEERTDD
jgi:hypothetical protein